VAATDATAAAAAADDTAPAADTIPPPSPKSVAKAAKAAKAEAAAVAVAAAAAAFSRGRGVRVPKTVNFFMLDRVYHATVTNAPLSSGPAGCKMPIFQEAQPPQPGLGCIRISLDIQGS
jgi:hypothetical protein